MKVLIWSMGGSGEHYGGPGMSIYRTYSKSRTDSEEFLLAHGNPEQRDYPLFSRSYLIHPVMSRPFHGLNQLRFIRRGKNWLTRNNEAFDVFLGLTSYHHAVVPAYHAATRLNKPAFVRVATAHSDLARKPGIKGLLGLAHARQKMLRKLDGVFAISKEIHDELLDLGLPKEKILPVNNGVDLDRFFPPARDEREKNKVELGLGQKFTLIFSGALVRKKNPAIVVEALRRLVAQGHDVQALFIGPEMEPDYYQEIRDAVRTHRLEDRTYFKGFVRDPERYYRAADLFVLPSSREGMSNAMLEAAACGLPIVTGKVSGASDLIEAGKTAGCIVDTISAESVHRALDMYVRNPALHEEHGRNAYETIQARFSAQFVYGQHVRIFRDAWKARQNSRVFLSLHPMSNGEMGGR